MNDIAKCTLPDVIHFLIFWQFECIFKFFKIKLKFENDGTLLDQCCRLRNDI